MGVNLPAFQHGRIDITWMRRANCKGLPSEVFFTRSSDKDARPRNTPRLRDYTAPNEVAEAKAKAICAGCEVRQECLDYAMRAGEIWGVWGGRTQEERKRMRRLAKRATPC